MNYLAIEKKEGRAPRGEEIGAKQAERGWSGRQHAGRGPSAPLLCCVALGQLTPLLDSRPAVLSSVQLLGVYEHICHGMLQTSLA